MRVLGIDPGSRIMGLGVVDANGRELKGVESVSVRLKEKELPPRLGQIFTAVSELIQRTQPDIVAVEQVFMGSNAKSALVLGQARGAAICAAINAGLPVTEYSAKQIKQAIVGTGGATKEQVQHMVRVLLGLAQVPQSDAADALACAICHANTAATQALLAKRQR